MVFEYCATCFNVVHRVLLTTFCVNRLSVVYAQVPKGGILKLV